MLHTSLRRNTPGELAGQTVSAAECRDLLAEIDRIDLLVPVDDPVTGETVAVATPTELHRAAKGTGLSAPPDTDAYRPTAAQRRFLRVRDRRCRMPGCLCRRHHRITTFAPGWHFHLHTDGTLTVRTPGGTTRHTRPPGWWPHPEPDPPGLDETAPPDVLRR